MLKETHIMLFSFELRVADLAFGHHQSRTALCFLGHWGPIPRKAIGCFFGCNPSLFLVANYSSFWATSELLQSTGYCSGLTVMWKTQCHKTSYGPMTGVMKSIIPVIGVYRIPWYTTVYPINLRFWDGYY